MDKDAESTQSTSNRAVGLSAWPTASSSSLTVTGSVSVTSQAERSTGCPNVDNSIALSEGVNNRTVGCTAN